MPERGTILDLDESLDIGVDGVQHLGGVLEDGVPAALSTKLSALARVNRFSTLNVATRSGVVMAVLLAQVIDATTLAPEGQMNKS